MTKMVPVVATVLVVAGVCLAQKPVQNISPKSHPNLAAAQKLIGDAFDRITAAQQKNEKGDLEGHAKKAKELLAQASEELKLAAAADKENRGPGQDDDRRPRRKRN